MDLQSLKRVYREFHFTQLHVSTKVIMILFLISSGITLVWWGFSGKTYLDLHIPWIGYGDFGVGFFQGKIFFSSIITFALTFVISYFLLVEKQFRHPIISIAVAALVVLSAAYVFEYVYLFLVKALFKYLTHFNFWFNLLAGLVVGFGFKFMRINKTSVILFSLFAFTMAVWYLGGYPQLENKEESVTIYKNYLGLPSYWAFPINALSKFLACMATATLLKGGIINKGMRDIPASAKEQNKIVSIIKRNRKIGIVVVPILIATLVLLGVQQLVSQDGASSNVSSLYPSSQHPEFSNETLITDLQNGHGFMKWSRVGTQNDDPNDYIKGSQSLKLITDGDNSPVYTRKWSISPPIDFANSNVKVWIKVNDTSRVEEFWFYLSSDNFASSWYTFKIERNISQLKDNTWTAITLSFNEAVITGSPDESAINAIQWRIRDKGTGAITGHWNAMVLLS